MKIVVVRKGPGTDEQPLKVKVRLHLEKIDKSGDEPVLTDYLIVDDEGRIEHPPLTEA